MIATLFFNDTATTQIYTLSLHDALPIWPPQPPREPTKLPRSGWPWPGAEPRMNFAESLRRQTILAHGVQRSEEHTSELQSHSDIVCRLLLEKKKRMNYTHKT